MTAPTLTENPLIPVVVIDDSGATSDLVSALVAGGIHCAEITLRTPSGFDAISKAAGTPNFAVGAGTVKSLDDLERSVGAGATFIVCPGFDEDIVNRALELGVEILPGVATSTEVMRASRSGMNTVKFFPADRLGGVDTINALASAFGEMSFVPSGGVSLQNARHYLSHSHIPAVSGSWMVARHLLREGDFGTIERLSREAVRAVA